MFYMAYPALLNLIVQIVYLFFQQQDLSECDTQSIGSLLIFAQKQCCKTAMQIGANLEKSAANLLAHCAVQFGAVAGFLNYLWSTGA